MKLVIFCPPDKQTDIDIEHPVELHAATFPSWARDDFEFYGQAWAKWFPRDIVMLVEEEACQTAGTS